MVSINTILCQVRTPPLLVVAGLIVVGMVLRGCGAGAEDTSPADTPPTPVIATEEITVYFPRQAQDREIEIEDVEAPGRLVLDEQGCLRLADGGLEPIVIWPPGFTVELVNGEVALVDEDSGDIIAHVGDDVDLHGAPREAQFLDDDVLEHPLPDACADADRYLVTGPGIGARD